MRAHDSSAPRPPSVLSQRLGALDALRGLAALFVLWEHALGRSSDSYEGFGLRHFNLGVFGVTLFFLVSGFIIPLSLSRSSGLATFWVNRVTRLYPMLWFSLATAGLLAYLGHYHLAAGFGVKGWLANASMLPSRFHQPAVGPLWTLGYELTFYVALSLISLVRGRHRYQWVALAVLVVACLRTWLPGSGPVGAHVGAFWYVTFFAGVLLSQVWLGETSRRAGLACFAGISTVGLVVLAMASPASTRLGDNPALSAQVTLASRGAAYIVFTVVILGLTRTRALPAAVTTLGTISYSIYLVHITVISAVPEVGAPLVAVALWTAITVLVSLATYRFVELPGIKLGHWLTRSSRQAL